MLFKTNIHYVWEPMAGGQPVSENIQIQHAARYDKDFLVDPKANNVCLKLTSCESERQALIIVADGPVTLDFGNNQIFEIGPGNPLVWHEATRQPCTIKGDFTEIRATNNTEFTRVIKIRIAERDVPAAAPVPASQPAPAPLVLAAPEPALAQ